MIYIIDIYSHATLCFPNFPSIMAILSLTFLKNLIVYPILYYYYSPIVNRLPQTDPWHWDEYWSEALTKLSDDVTSGHFRYALTNPTTKG